MSAQANESEGANANRTRGWKWVALALGLLIVLTVTCVTSAVWGGLIGYALGRHSEHHMDYPDMPYQEPYSPMPEMPDIPDMPEMPYLEELPWLGVSFVMGEEGAEVTSVVPGSPADDEGLEVGDIITEVDGRNVTASRPLDELILQYDPGDRVELTILRDGQEIEVRVRLASRLEGWMPFEQDDAPFQMPIEPNWQG